MQTLSLLNRRAFLHSSVLSALAMGGCVSVPRAGQGYIDAHVHVWTPDTGRYPLAEGFTREKNMIPGSFLPRELFAQCRPQGVSRVVLIQMSFYKFDNSYMLESISRHPGVFSGVGIVDETKADVVEAMKALAARGVRGFRVRADRQKAEGWKDSEGMKKMWSQAADSDLSICLLADPDALPAVHTMCRAYPKTRVVIDHFARIGKIGPVQKTDLERLRKLSDFEHTFVKTSAFYALGAKKAPYTDLGPMIRTLKGVYGASRLMWASDCPFQ